MIAASSAGVAFLIVAWVRVLRWYLLTVATHNNLVLLDQVLESRQRERSERVSESKNFEIFACEQALRIHDLSMDEVLSGVVGDGGDGAIDGTFVILRGELLEDDHEIFDAEFSPTRMPAGSILELWLVQAKRETSFTETAIDLVADSCRRLLDLGALDSDLEALYNSDIVKRTGMFRRALTLLASRHPKVRVHFVYATKGDTATVNSRVARKAEDLRRQFQEVMTGAEGEVEFLGAAELWRRSNDFPSYTMQLPYQEEATSKDSHVALVKLRDYYDFLVDEHGELRRHIFDLNVRDYQGSVEVNLEIEASLKAQTAPEFWWLNNGITIVCTQASAANRVFSLDDVQVVNGLQTSQTIYEVLRRMEPTHSAFERAVLVRILVTRDDEKTRDLVIRATNRQTSVPVASLRATEQIQRDIEAYFASHGWYYDRRKNYYRNIGKSAERIVSIPLLAQAVMAMGLGRPDYSRARPSSLLKRNEDYQRVFDATVPLPIFLWLARVQRAIDTFLMSEKVGTTRASRTNIRFHVAMVAVTRMHGERIYHPKQLESLAIAGDLPAEDRMIEALGIVTALLVMEAGGMDRLAKGQEFVDKLHANALGDHAILLEKARSVFERSSDY